MFKLHSHELFIWDEKRIKEKLLNRVNLSLIDYIIKMRDYLIGIIEKDITEDYPEWFVYNLKVIMDEFVEILESPNTTSEMDFNDKLADFRASYMNYGVSKDSKPMVFNLHFIEDYARSLRLEREIKQFKNTIDAVDKSIKDFKSVGDNELKSFQDKFNILKSDADSTLAIVKQEAGKIVVKDYAKIFDQQALEHSNFFCDPNATDGYKFKFTLGNAQSWMLFAVISLSILIYSYTRLDTIFSLKNEKAFTPEVIVHMIGRIVAISLFIFIVSFCFKQFRVNMHLYTLNKHRANTLKSFEYLTHSPNPLAPESYNAILMEVAKAIYESGHTGYINISDTNSDMPSIIDMSKVITQPRG